MDELARAWRPSPKWASHVHDVTAALERDPEDCRAWCELAMMFGDTHAAPLALVVCLHARTLAGDQRRVRAHMALCLLDLRLGAAETSPIPLRAMGDEGTVAADSAALAAWTAEHLAEFDGDAARAARHALAIAVARLAT